MRLYRITVPSFPLPPVTVLSWSRQQAIDHFRKYHPEAGRYVVQAQHVTLAEQEAQGRASPG